MNCPMVSIITPCLNPGDRLARCIASVSAQTYPFVEHIVVDGGSHDATVELLAKSGLTFTSEPDSGQSDAINKGFALARGSVMGWLNADDELQRTAVHRAIDAMDRGSRWCTGSVLITGPDGHLSRIVRPPRDVRPDHFFAGNPIPQPGSFWSRELWDLVGPLRKDLHYAMDLDLWLRFFDLDGPPIRVRGRHQAVFEVHAGSKSGSVDNSEFTLDMVRAFAGAGWWEHAGAALGRAAALGGDPAALDSLSDRIMEEHEVAFAAAASAESIVQTLKGASGLSANPMDLTRALSHQAGRSRLVGAGRWALASLEASARSRWRDGSVEL